MSKTITIIFSILLITSTFGQNVENKVELCVINMLGAKIYEKQTFESKTLRKLKVGEKIIIENIIQTEEKIEIGKGFSLSGYWIKPFNINGFVFSSDLTSKDVEILSQYGHTKINLLGEMTGSRDKETLVRTEKGEFLKYYEYKYYINGTYTYAKFDGCFDHITEYKNLSINEVYHQMVSDFCGKLKENDFRIPKFQGINDNQIEFSVEIGATENLKIEIKENGVFKVSSHNCT